MHDMTAHAAQHHAPPQGFIRKHVFSLDHKVIGKQYYALALVAVFVGMVLSGVTAYLSTKFLMKYFEKGTLIPFAYYCWGAGLVALILFATMFRNVVH